MSKSTKKAKVEEKVKEQEEEEVLPVQEQEQEQPSDELQVEELPEEVNLKNLVGKVFVLTHAEIDQGTSFNIIHLTLKDENGNEIYARTTSKAIELNVRRLMDKGLNNGKAFRVCIQEQKSKYNTPMLVFMPASMCEKK
jgi:hypothetical protein|uniref:Uncharacterized protein n=1 Tax=Candidatus Aramenus sulfurataquae TaxID=1326980 RepID=A0AAE3FM20_9CREN|nr:hypothetical protein [Candidatus Aramenus sulfurataquae]